MADQTITGCVCAPNGEIVTMTTSNDFNAIDIADFRASSMTSLNDRRSIMLIRQAVRALKPGYRFVEIGSHLGGTLYPFLADPACSGALSIDKRPPAQFDERGAMYELEGNSTQRMIAHLRQFADERVMSKLVTFDGDASDLPSALVSGPIDLAFIDGEHTNVAVLRDFLSLRNHLAPDAMIFFHDTNILFDGIASIELVLKHLSIPHATYFLPDVIGVIALNQSMAQAASLFAPHALNRDAYCVEARQWLYGQIIANQQGIAPPRVSKPLHKRLARSIEKWKARLSA